MRRVAGVVALAFVAIGAFSTLALLADLAWPERAVDWLTMLAVLGVEGAVLVAVALVGLRLLRPEERATDVAPRPDRRPPVAPVPDTELVDVPEPVTACPDCGFLGIRMLTLQDGVALGGGEIGDKMSCPRCGYQGLAIRFEKRADYGDFLREMARPD